SRFRANRCDLAGDFVTQHKRVGETSMTRSLPHKNVAPAHAAGAPPKEHLTPLWRRRCIDIAIDQNIGSAMPLSHGSFHGVGHLALSVGATGIRTSSSRTTAAIHNG